ncbi:metallophosphoesterase [Vampirovibrio sp.]|uniref:metallophosphoesterase family protein n=1 Tax=Vampirovibrio sp. TaxID=2717857 RepID=UPI0035943A54
MKLGIIADIHGNYPALKAVLAELDGLGVQDIISLGDVAGYYSMINECIQALRERSIVNIMGNHDHYLAFNAGCPRSNAANQCLNYQRQVITEDHKAWLSRSPASLSRGALRMVHGGWHDVREEYLVQPSASYFEKLEGRFFFSGHVHVQILVPLGAKTYCNPGSVGQPRDGKPEAGFAVFEDDVITLHRVAYDVDATAQAMKNAGFAPYFYENLYQGTRIGGNISTIRPTA